MGFVSNFVSDLKKERKINKKIDKAKEIKEIQATKQSYTDYGLSPEEQEFMARKQVKKAKMQKKVDAISSGLGNVANNFEGSMFDDAPARQAPKSKSSKGKGKNKSKKKESDDPFDFDLDFGF